MADYLFLGGGRGQYNKAQKIKGYISGTTNDIELKISEYTYLNYLYHSI